MDPINNNNSTSSASPKAIEHGLILSPSSNEGFPSSSSSSSTSTATTSGPILHPHNEIQSIEYWQEISRRQAIMLTELQSRIRNFSMIPDNGPPTSSTTTSNVYGSIGNDQGPIVTTEKNRIPIQSLSTTSLSSDTSQFIDTESSIYSLSSVSNRYPPNSTKNNNSSKDYVLYRNKLLIDKLMNERNHNQQRIHYLEKQNKFYQNHIQLLQETVDKDKAYTHELHRLHNDSVTKLQHGVRNLQATILRNNQLFNHERSLYTVYIETSNNEIQRLQHQLKHQQNAEVSSGKEQN